MAAAPTNIPVRHRQRLPLLAPLPVPAVAVAVAVAVAAGNAAAAEGLHLQEVLRRVAERGPEAAAARAQVQVAQAEVRTAGMLPNPGLTLSAGQSEPIFAASLQLRLPILGQRGAHVAAAERGVVQAQAEAQLALWRLRHDARLAYFAVARSEDAGVTAQEVEALTRRVAEIAAERFDTGAGSRLEKEQAALVHVRALQDVSDRRAAAQVARLELGRLLGAPAADLGRLGDALAAVGPTPALDSLLAEAQARHPELRALFAERDAALGRARAARADRRPLIILDLGGEVLDPTTCSPDLPAPTRRCVGPRGNLGFDLPVLNWNGGPIARAEAEARAAEARSGAAARRVESAVRAAHTSLSAAQLRARFFDAEYVPAASSVERMAREGFAIGRTGILPLIEAERALLEARLGRTEALYAVQAARADLEEASGVVLSAP